MADQGKALSGVGVFTLLFAACFTVMVGSVITPALPSIAEHLGFASASSWLVTLPSLGVVVFGAVAGRFIDRMGAYVAMVLGLVLYGVLGFGVVCLPLSQSVVLVDRLLLGGATALVMASGTALIAEFFEGEQRLRMIAVQGMAIEVGGVVFLSLGGALGARSWKLPFGIYLLSWVCLGFVLLAIPRRRAGVREKAKSGDAAPKRVTSILVAATLAMTIFFVAFLTLPGSLAVRFHWSEAGVGYFMAFISLMAVVFAGTLPLVSRKVPMRRLLAGAFVLYGCAHLLMGLSTSLYGMVAGAVLMGGAFGYSIPVVNHLMVEESSAGTRGKNLGALSICIFLGQFLSSFVGLVSADGARMMAMTGVVALVVGCGWFVFVRKSYPTTA